MAREMRRRVAAHAGPLYVLFSPFERDRAITAVDDYGLRLGGTCREVTSNLTSELTLCELQRS
jgi:hypothetical protein